MIVLFGMLPTTSSLLAFKDTYNDQVSHKNVESWGKLIWSSITLQNCWGFGESFKILLKPMIIFLKEAFPRSLVMSYVGIIWKKLNTFSWSVLLLEIFGLGLKKSLTE